ncbi:MAG: VTT domain-containing protein [Planctomycetia bacterium]|nr:VTT domain-containing protein [Planctomycetia bacterium]
MAQAAHQLDDAMPRPDLRTKQSSTRGRRASTWVKWISALIIVACVVLIVRLLPVENVVRWLTGWVRSLGPWGPIAFGLIYIVAAVLFVPGLALTLAAGAIFGLTLGTLTVSIASTLAASIAFLIARYFARGAVERTAHRYPKFSSIDKAIGAGGWKIIALLRLSPAVPFSAGNYLYGLTAIRFWPYMLASWLAMLPGTFLYVYLGYLGQTGIAGGHRTPGQWAMMIVGLLATIVVTFYVTSLARKAMRGRVEDSVKEDAPDRDHDMQSTSSIRGAVMMSVVAALSVIATACAYLNKTKISGLFGPPRVTLTETYQDKPGGATFDHSVFNELVGKYVAAGGWVDYEGLRRDSAQLDAYIASLAAAPFADLGRNEKFALLINGYNAFTLRLILDHYPLKSIKDIPADKRWDEKRWIISGRTWSLTQIEHEQVRPNFKEPRAHFALVCAAIGCPPLRSEAYVGNRVDEQLEDQARYVHGHKQWFWHEPEKQMVHLTSLYKWYGNDFEQVADGSVLNFAARYSATLKAALDSGRKPTNDWLDYDWTLNSVANKEKVE